MERAKYSTQITLLRKFVNPRKIHIVALSETWLTADDHINMKFYNIYRKDRSDGYGGVAIFVHSSIKSQIYKTNNNNTAIEFVSVKLFNCDIDYIFSIYCAPSAGTLQNDWEGLFSMASTNSLILGDFNGHHTNWSYKTDRRGQQIFDALLDHNQVSLNDGSPTRIKVVNSIVQKSAPDISVTSSNGSLKFNWTVMNETLGSDHLIIKISTSGQTSLRIPRLKRNLKNADWTSYRNLLNELFFDFKYDANTQTCYNNFIEYINLAADICIPYIKINQSNQNKFSPKPYWNTALSKSVAERRLALSKFRRNSTPENYAILQDKIRSTQKLLRRVKSEAWYKFCGSLNHNTPQSTLWRKMKWLKGYRSPTQHIDKLMADELLHSLAPDSASPADPTFTARNVVLEVPITISEFHKCIRSKDTSPGCDDISYSMIKKLPHKAMEVLIYIYNKCLSSGFVPEQWRDIIIIPIPKSGSVAASRPISMMACLCKVFHNILMNRLEWFIEKNNLFSNNTTGFRKYRSTYDNLTSLVSIIQSGFSKNLTTVACFIDINNAYNNVDLQSLLRIMEQVGVGASICTYIWNFLKSRRLIIQSDDYYICRTTSRGLAQGDPLSPLLFNIATMHICHIIKNVFILQYADDFVLFTTCSDLSTASRDLQWSLNIFYKLIINLGLEISSSKSKVCIFKRGRREESVNLEIDRIPLQVVNNIKYLGMWIDRSLKWKKHIDEVQETVLKFLRFFKCLSGSGWGVHPIHLKRIYCSIIRSRLDYGSFLYDNCAEIHLSKLEKIQNMCMRVIGGFIKSTPIHVMQNELQLPPLHVRRHYLAGKFWLKIKSYSDNNIINILDKLETLCQNPYWTTKKIPLLIKLHELLKLRQVYVSSHLEMFTLDTWINKVNLTDIIKLHIDTVDRGKKYYNVLGLRGVCVRFMNNAYSQYYKIFTDGSKHSEGVGAAVYDPQENIPIKLNIDTFDISIMNTELIAILEALSYIDSFKQGKYVVFSDSKSALQHLLRCASNYRGTPVAYHIIRALHSLYSKGKNVVLQWIPAHIGLRENEEADFWAKVASIDGIPVRHIPYYMDLMYVVKEQGACLWREYFDQRALSRGIWYKTIQPSLCRSVWFDHANMSRSDIVTALRLRSGHIPLNSFGYLMGKVASPNCPNCNMIEDVYHVIMECVRNEAERAALSLRLSFDVGLGNSILAFPLSEEAKKMFKMVQKAVRMR